MNDPLVPDRVEMFDGASSPEEFVINGDAFVHHYLISRAQLKPSETVLDLGSGNGQKARPLTKYLTTGSYVGFDVVKMGIDWCADKYRPWPNFHFDWAEVRSDWYNKSATITADNYIFPYADETFDLAFAASLATHLLPSELENYLKQTHRVLKSRGRLFVTFFLLNNRNRRSKSIIQGCQFQEVSPEYSVLDTASPRRGVAHDELNIRYLFERAGFKIIEITFGTWPDGIDLVGAHQDTILAIKT